MELFAFTLMISYALGCLLLLVIWNFKFARTTDELVVSETFVSIIIPVRNEEGNIINLLQCIDNQNYKKDMFELIIANDSSDDDTVRLIEGYRVSSDMKIIIINLKEKCNNFSPKKRAITEALKIAKGELIMTTDGDCSMNSKWISSVVNCYHKTGTYFISSPVSFISEDKLNLFQKVWGFFQIIEFGSLVGAGACSIKLGSPNMCSGANIAYKKTIFEAVNGYEGNEEIASGDDEFLMHKISDRFPGKIQFLKSFNAVVETYAHKSVSSFFVQRKRWASKWRFYKNWQPTALAIYIAVVNGFTVWVILTGQIQLVLLKFSFEFLFLSSVVIFFKKPRAILFIPLTQLIYPFYVFVMAIVAQGKKTYVWKGRQLK